MRNGDLNASNNFLHALAQPCSGKRTHDSGKLRRAGEEEDRRRILVRQELHRLGDLVRTPPIRTRASTSSVYGRRSTRQWTKVTATSTSPTACYQSPLEVSPRWLRVDPVAPIRSNPRFKALAQQEEA